MPATTCSLSDQIRDVAAVWARSQHQLVVLAARFADSGEWALAGSPTPAHWIATTADVEDCTAREWIRIGRQLRHLPAIAAAFDTGMISYSKVRTLTRIATPTNEHHLLPIAQQVPASQLGAALARWTTETTSPEELAEHHQRQRSVRWRTEPDGMTTFTLRLPPMLAGILIALLTTLVMRNTTRRGINASAGRPTLAQQHADALQTLLTDRAGTIDTEVIVHVRGDGNTLDDGTPIPDTVVEGIIPQSFIRALIHDAERHPVNVSHKRRHPTTRQKRLVKERDRVCVDCGRSDLLQYDHNPPYAQTGHTRTDETNLRCAPCHHKRHAS